MIRPHLVLNTTRVEPRTARPDTGDGAGARRSPRPTLVVLPGGRAGAPAPFVVSPPGLASVSPPSTERAPVRGTVPAARAARAAEVDPCRCRQLRPRWR